MNRFIRGRYLGSLGSRPDWLVIVLEVDLSAPIMCCDENTDMYMLQLATGIQIAKFSLAKNIIACANAVTWNIQKHIVKYPMGKGRPKYID